MWSEVNKGQLGSILAITREQNGCQGWELCYCDPIVNPHLGDLWPQVDLWWPVLVFLAIWIFVAIFGSQRYLAIKMIHQLTLCDLRVRSYQRSSCSFVCISTARMVVQTCHVAFWNQCVKLHLTIRSKVKILIKYAHFGRYGAKKKVCQYSDIR